MFLVLHFLISHVWPRDHIDHRKSVDRLSDRKTFLNESNYIFDESDVDLADLFTESINNLGILALGIIFWMNLGSLEYLRPKWAPKHGWKRFTFKYIWN